jgi:ribosome biogenesis protein Tsr3
MILDLINSLRKYFNQRCGVGTLDFSFPSNADSFGQLYSEKPTLIFRNPVQYHTMFNFNDIESLKTLKVTDIKNWGQQISYEKLGKNIRDDFQIY